MTEHDAFLQSIVENPDDDAPRLIYADWLEENGQPERAEFIRVQCELAKIGLVTMPDGAQFMRTGCEEDDRREIRLRQRERELFNWNSHKWLFTLPGGLRPILPDAQRKCFRRGFIERVEYTCQQWLDHGPAILAACPTIREVRISNLSDYVRPVDGERNRRVYCEGHSTPTQIYLLIECDDISPIRPGRFPWWKRFPNLAAAESAFSKAALAYARSQLIAVNT